MFKLNILILSKTEENSLICLNSADEPVIKKEGSRDVILHPEAVSSFDALISPDSSVNLFFTTSGGSLLWLKYKDGDTDVKPIMLGKDKNSKICSVKVLSVNGIFHLFYCLNSKNRYLVHQVMTADNLYEPNVIDTVGKRFVYDVRADNAMNLHIVYSSEEGTVRYRQYVNSQKTLTDYKNVCNADVRALCICICKERIFCAYTENKNSNTAVYLVSVLDSNVKKTVLSVGSRAQLCLNVVNDTLMLHMTDEGSCYEIKSDLNLNCSRAVFLGRSSGIFKIISSDGKNTAKTYPVTRDNEPFSGYSDFAPAITFSDTMPKPKGNDVEEFAGEYKSAFDYKAMELKEEELFGSIAKINASLKVLTQLSERILEEIKSQKEEKFINHDDEV